MWELKVTIENLFSALYDDTQKTISWYAPMDYFFSDFVYLLLMVSMKTMNYWVCISLPRNRVMWLSISNLLLSA